MFFRKKDDEFRPERIDELAEELNEVHKELLKHNDRIEYLQENLEKDLSIYKIKRILAEYNTGSELHEKISKIEHQTNLQLKAMVKELEKDLAIYESLD